MLFCDCFHLAEYFQSSLKYQCFISFYGWIMFHCIDVPHFIYSFIGWWTFGLFLFFTILIYYEHLYIRFVWTCFHFSWEYILRSGIGGSQGNSNYTFWGTARLFGTAPIPFSIPTGSILSIYFICFLYIYSIHFNTFFFKDSEHSWSGLLSFCL